MIRSGLLLLLLLLLPVHSIADDTETQLKDFLKSRTVMESIYFKPSSTQLTSVAMKQLASFVTKINGTDDKKTLFRIEGFSSQDGYAIDNVNLSMNRAIAVRTYLKEHYGVSIEIFLTGFGGVPDTEGDGEKARRVDIALYQKPDAAIALFDDQGTVEKIVLK
ncbi:MAG: OmpA family protein [Geopsychrobacter sp.]|nr:OmpA family protein [Geopsychrobacter sp.]